MKQLIFLFSLLVICVSAFSQDKTISKSMSSGAIYYQTGFTSADTFTTNQDTIDLVIKYTGTYVYKLSVKTRFDIISGADTTLSVSVFGKEFEDDPTWVQIIAATTTDQVLANNTIQTLTSDWTWSVAGATDTFNSDSTTTVATRTVTPLDKTYRYYRIRYIYNGPDNSAGSGIKLDDFEIKMAP